MEVDLTVSLEKVLAMDEFRKSQDVLGLKKNLKMMMGN